MNFYIIFKFTFIASENKNQKKNNIQIIDLNISNFIVIP